MPRRSNDLPDVDFLFRFIGKPFVSPNWACAYIGIGLVMTLMQMFFVGSPTPEPALSPIDVMTRQLQAIYGLRFLVPALCFSVVGCLGLLTCLVRDWINRAD